MLVKKINWNFIDKNLLHGSINGVSMFSITYENGYWYTLSSFLYNIFSQAIINYKKDIDEKRFKKIENAKKYCEKVLMKKFFDIFFINSLIDFKKLIIQMKKVSPENSINYNYLIEIINGILKARK